MTRSTRSSTSARPRIFPYGDTGTSMRVTAVNMNGSGDRHGRMEPGGGHHTAYTADQAMNSIVPATLRTADTQLIMAEVYYTYTPAVGYVITGDIAMEDRMFFVPRLVTKIKLCATATSTTACPDGPATQPAGAPGAPPRSGAAGHRRSALLVTSKLEPLIVRGSTAT